MRRRRHPKGCGAPGCVHHAPPAPKPAPPRHVRLVDAAGRPLEVRPDQVADLIEAGLAAEVLPERIEEWPASREAMAAGRLDALRRWLAELEPPEAPEPVRELVGPRPTPRPGKGIRGRSAELLILDDPFP